MNFLIFMVDQMQSYSLGCNGNSQVKTPNLDKLAKEGVSFKRAYCPSPTCMPSRSSFITGLTAKQHGCITNGTNLPETVPTIPELLHQNGYRTYCAGKFHFQATANSDLVEFGDASTAESKKEWDSGQYTSLPSPYYGFYETNYVGGHGFGNFGEYTAWLKENHPGVFEKYTPSNPDKEDGTPSLSIDVPKEVHYNHWIADKTMSFLDSVGDESFFAVCSFPDPHAPISACRPYAELYPPEEMEITKSLEDAVDSLPFLQKRREQFFHEKGNKSKAYIQELVSQTYGMITHIDDNVGRVMKKLSEKNLEKDTVICFVADHGEYLGCHNLLGKAEWLYEELVRVPFIVKVPNGIAKGATEQVVSTLDFAPTILDLAGLSPYALSVRNQGHAKPLPLPGQNLKGFLMENTPLEKEFAVVEFEEDWHPGENYRERVIVTAQYKLAIFPEIGEGMLFDLQADPFEMQNLFNDEKHQHIKHELMEKMLYYLVRNDRQDLPRPVAY